VKKYQDVFPAELTSLPPSQEVEFAIDLVPRAAPVSRTPYRIAPSRIEGIEKATGRTIETELYQAKCVAVGSTSVVCEEERWHVNALH
jgi:hypothetical protein